MRKYKDFKEFMEDNYLDEIVEKLCPYIINHKDSFENELFHTITYIDKDEIIYSIRGVTYNELDSDHIEIRTTVEAQVPFKGYSGKEIDYGDDIKYYNVFFTALLDNGLKNMRCINISEYSKASFDIDKSLSQSWLNYIREEDIDKYAEDFLKRNYPMSLLQPMPINPIEIVKALGMTMYYAPLGDNIFGKTYFGEETVIVYDDLINRNKTEIQTTPGTLLVNPDVYFMRNIGSANNTIIHECVHWDMHRRAFELQSILQGGKRHISCEIVEDKYDGIGPNESALKWMEWQANQLAPRILMPAKTTRKIYTDLLRDSHNNSLSYPYKIQDIVEKIANYFSVSLISAKIRLFELGFEEVEGTCIYCDNKIIYPFSFKKGIIDKNHSFIIDETNLIICLATNPKLMELYCKGVLVYTNCMLCINNSKYVTMDLSNKYVLTDYALEHADECCFLFKRKYSASNNYSDTFYRRCFLCREVDSEDFVPVEYDRENKINQTKENLDFEIDTIMESIDHEMENIKSKMRSGLDGALDYYMKEKKITAEDITERCGVSTVTVSSYRNNKNITYEKGTVLALCKALYLLPHEAEYVLFQAGIDIRNLSPANIIIRHLITDHMDDTWSQWVYILLQANISNDWIPSKNPIVIKIKKMKALNDINMINEEMNLSSSKTDEDL